MKCALKCIVELSKKFCIFSLSVPFSVLKNCMLKTICKHIPFRLFSLIFISSFCTFYYFSTLSSPKKYISLVFFAIKPHSSIALRNLWHLDVHMCTCRGIKGVGDKTRELKLFVCCCWAIEGFLYRLSAVTVIAIFLHFFLCY